MPIHFDADNRQVFVDFIGGDIVAGLCGDDDGNADCIGIAESPQRGVPSELVPDDVNAGTPAVVLRFQTREAFDSFFLLLMQYRTERFKT